MNKTELVKEVGKRTGFTQTDISEVIEKIFNIIEEEVLKGEMVKIDWLTIGGSVVPERKCRNPKTQEEFMSPACMKPYSKIGVSLKKKAKEVKV